MRRGTGRALATAAVLALSASLLQLSEAPGALAASSTAPTDGAGGPVLADAQWAGSEADARSIAVQYGHSVSVTGETTPTSEVEALPDGELQLVVDSVPQRALVGGAWTPVDPTLAAGDDGFLAPAVAAEPVEFSPGGSDVMAKVQADDGSWADEVWPYGDLPAPTVSGSSATYPSVLPGVDLVLTANPSGMSEVLVVEDAQAAADPQLAELELGVRDATLSTDAVHATLATTSEGGQVTAGEPQWWDSSTPGATAAGPVGAQEPAPLAHAVAATAETLDVADALDSDVTYPVFIDPDWSSGDNDHWYDDKDYPDQSYLNGNENADWLGTGAAENTYTSRSFWQFPTSALAGKSVTTSKLSLYEQYQGASNAVELYLLQTHVTPGATWNQENAVSGAWDHPQVSLTPAVGTVGIDVTHSMQWVASSSQSVVQFGLRATDETDQSTRKHWNLNATLTVTYDSAPGTPTGLQIVSPVRGCGTSSAPAFLNSAASNIDLQATTSDADSGDKVAVTFTVATTGGTTVWTHTTSATAQGAVATVIPKGSFGEGAYQWTATPTDSEGVDGPASATCYFTADNTPPPLPTVTTSATSVTVGTPFAVSVTSASSAHVVRYEYWWENELPAGDDPVNSVATVPYTPTLDDAIPACPSYQTAYSFVCASSGAATLSVAPSEEAGSLWVMAIDAAGNISTASTPVAQHQGWLGVLAGDDPKVTDANGDIWRTSDGVTSATSFTDPRGNSVSLSVNASASSAAALTSDTPDDTQNAGTKLQGIYGAFYLPGNVTLARSNVSGDRVSYIEGGAPSGSALIALLGELPPLDEPQPTGTKTLYTCDVGGTDEMTSTSTTCESTGATPKALGYIFSSSGTGRIPLIRCRKDGDHFDSIDSACEGNTVDGTLGYIYPASVFKTSATGLIDTTKSFSAAAWVYPENASGGTTFHNIIAEGGTQSSGFWLQERTGGSGSTGGPASFCIRTQNEDPVATTCATSPQGLPLKTWTLVVGIWNAADHQLSLHVGGDYDANTVTVPYSVPSGDTTAAGPIMVGSGISGTKQATQWDGLIANPAVFQGVVDPQQYVHLDDLTPLH